MNRVGNLKISRRNLLLALLSFLPSSRALAWTGTRIRKSSKSKAMSGSFIATGANGTLLTSPDGSTWTARTSGVSVALHGIGSSGTNYMVGTATAGQLLSSSDGITWSSISTGMGYAINAVCYGAGRWVAGGGSGYTCSVYGSADGVTWSQVATNLGAVILGGTYANGQFVLVGAAFATGTSPDGITWTARRSTTGGNDYYGVAANSSTYAIVGALYSSGYIKSVLYTSDFSSYPSGYSGSSGYIFGVVWSGTKFCAVGQSGLILTSTTGSTWTTQTSGISTDLTGVAWNGSKFCAVGSGGKILTSADGVTWTSQSSGTTNDLASVLGV